MVKGPEGFQCACPDFELTGRTCKHGYAVEFMLRRETKPDGTVIETRAARVTYSQPWAAYNKARAYWAKPTDISNIVKCRSIIDMGSRGALVARRRLFGSRSGI